MELILNNWDSILVILILAGVIAFLLYNGKRGVVNEIIYHVVTELERSYASGTGSLKLAAAVEMIYPKLPAVIRLFVTANRLKEWIEEGLAEAKKRWAANPALLKTKEDNI